VNNSNCCVLPIGTFIETETGTRGRN